MNAMIQQLFDYALRQYGVEPDYPFSADPEIPVLRHRGTRKWFAIFMTVSRAALMMFVLGISGSLFCLTYGRVLKRYRYEEA